MEIARRKAEARANRALLEAADAKAREADPARWGEVKDQAHIDALNRTGADVALDLKGRVKWAYRGDIFDTLAKREAITDAQLSGIRRLQRDMAERAGIGGGNTEDLGTFVDGGNGDAAGVTQRMVDAGARVDDVLAMVGPPASRVLRDLLEPPVTTGASPDWRAVIAHHTGETYEKSQPALLRFAAQSLADCYACIDRGKGRR